VIRKHAVAREGKRAVGSEALVCGACAAWYRVYATPGKVRLCLAKFRMRIDADIWAEVVHRNNPTWRVEVE
jgi:hypothetical protein